MYYSSGHRWRLVYDAKYQSAKKRKAAGARDGAAYAATAAMKRLWTEPCSAWRTLIRASLSRQA
eukprot:4342952-Pyramimonas_sp.AAC.1